MTTNLDDARALATQLKERGERAGTEPILATDLLRAERTLRALAAELEAARMTIKRLAEGRKGDPAA